MQAHVRFCRRDNCAGGPGANRHRCQSSPGIARRKIENMMTSGQFDMNYQATLHLQYQKPRCHLCCHGPGWNFALIPLQSPPPFAGIEGLSRPASLRPPQKPSQHCGGYQFIHRSRPECIPHHLSRRLYMLVPNSLPPSP